MITFKQFISEDGHNFEDLKEVIVDCRPWFEQAGQRFVVRGLSSRSVQSGMAYSFGPDANNFFYRKTVRKDRNPRDMNLQMHNHIDRYLKNKFGLRGRSESMFCFGDNESNNAGDYGRIYLVIPIGQFQFLWSPHIEDLNTHIEDQLHVRSSMSDWEEKVEEILDDGDYQNTNLKAAIASGNEIMILCDHYYAFYPEDKPEILKAIE